MTKKRQELENYEMRATDDQLRRVSELAKRQIASEKIVEAFTEQLEQAQRVLDEIRHDQLPALMQEIGLSMVKLDTGEKVELKAVVKASIAKANKEQAFSWLRENGHGSLIKNKITTQFGMGEEEQAQALLQELTQQGLEVTQDETVHVQTLTAFVKEQLKNGVNIPMDLLGVFEYQEVKIKQGGDR
jgi:hypothetical protein